MEGHAAHLVSSGPNKNGDAFSPEALKKLAEQLLGQEVKSQSGTVTGHIVAVDPDRETLRVTIEALDGHRTTTPVMLGNPEIPKSPLEDPAMLAALSQQLKTAKSKFIMNEPEVPLIPLAPRRPRGLGILGLLAGSLGIPFAGIPRQRTAGPREKTPEEVAASLRASDDHRRVSAVRRQDYNKRRAAREYKAALHNRVWAAQPNMRAHFTYLAERAGVAVA